MTSADSSRALLERMLAKVRAMRTALDEVATATPPIATGEIDRARAAIDDLERRIEQLLDRAAPARRPSERGSPERGSPERAGA